MSAAQRSASRLGVRSDTLDSELLNSTSLLHTKMNNNIFRISYLDTGIVAPTLCKNDDETIRAYKKGTGTIPVTRIHCSVPCKQCSGFVTFSYRTNPDSRIRSSN
jgi:hypothetical protein